MEFVIPTNPGLEKLPDDNRDYQYGGIFGAEKYPRVFKRELPAGLDIPYQKQVPSCVACTFTFINQYKSFLEHGKKLNLSWRKVHAETGGYNRGRHYRTVAKHLQIAGQPQDVYCPDLPELSEGNFMDVRLSPEGEKNALKRKIGAYSFVSSNLDELLPALVREPIAIALGGNNKDWSRSKEIIKKENPTAWYHSICLWDYNLDEGWLGIYNWWGDEYRKLDINYPLTGVLSFRDLPDGKNIMQKIIGLEKNGVKTDQYIEANGVKHKLANVAMLEDLHNAGLVDKNLVEWKDKIDGIIGNEWGALVRD